MNKKQCKSCRQDFEPRAQVPKQAYCSKPKCQRTRRLRWKKQKLKTDPDHRKNQRDAQRRWLDKNPDYFRRYRKARSKGPEANPQKPGPKKPRSPGSEGAEDKGSHPAKIDAHPRGPDAEDKGPRLAKIDACPLENQIFSGTYRIIPVEGTGGVKIDACTVKIQVISIP